MRSQVTSLFPYSSGLEGMPGALYSSLGFLEAFVGSRPHSLQQFRDPLRLTHDRRQIAVKGRVRIAALEQIAVPDDRSRAPLISDATASVVRHRLDRSGTSDEHLQLLCTHATANISAIGRSAWTCTSEKASFRRATTFSVPTVRPFDTSGISSVDRKPAVNSTFASRKSARPPACRSGSTVRQPARRSRWPCFRP